MKNKKNESNNIVKYAAVGTALATLAASAYFFLGPKGKKNQKAAKAWALKMKAEIVEKLETAKDVSEPVYHQIIDAVAAKYKKGVKIGHAEVDELASELKKHWKTFSKPVKKVKKATK